MIEIEGPGTTELASRPKGGIAKPSGVMTVGALEKKLLERFPAEDAEEWDHTGLLVGDPSLEITGVVCALDVTIDAIQRTHDAGANVLLTHHPAYLDAPEKVSPSRVVAATTGIAVYEAVRLGIALMNFHTALDVSEEASRMLPGMLGLEFEGIAVPIAAEGKGYGQICTIRSADAPITLSQLAARCLSVFGRPPRVWGDMAKRMETIVTATGAAGNVLAVCPALGIDCLVAGEVKYHDALDAIQNGISIIELGHDVSEIPFAAVLGAAAVRCGVDANIVEILDQSGNWQCPESTRI